MESHSWALLVSAVIAMALGAVWYGPLFGKFWLEVSGADAADLAAREAMQKETGTLYAIQFGLTLLQLYVLSHFVNNAWDTLEGIKTALLAWLGFVVPTLAGSAMWNARPMRTRSALFMLSAGYQFVCFFIFGIILSLW